MNEKQNGHVQQTKNRKRAKYKTNQNKTKEKSWNEACVSTEKLMVHKQKSRMVCLVLVLLLVFPFRFFLNLKQLSGIKSKWKEIDLNSQFVCVLNFNADELAIDDGSRLLVFSIQITAAFHWVFTSVNCVSFDLLLFFSHSLAFIGHFIEADTVSMTNKLRQMSTTAIESKIVCFLVAKSTKCGTITQLFRLFHPKHKTNCLLLLTHAHKNSLSRGLLFNDRQHNEKLNDSGVNGWKLKSPTNFDASKNVNSFFLSLQFGEKLPTFVSKLRWKTE